MTDVYVIAPVRAHRESLSMALNHAEKLSVVGTAATVAEALPRLLDLDVDVAVLDASMPQEVDLFAPSEPEPEVRLLAIGIPEVDAVDWFEAGVSGCVPPEASLEELAVAVASVARGELVTSSEVTARLISRIRRLAAEVPRTRAEARLTPRQREVLDLVADGLSNKEIAWRLSIQEQTVKNHVQSILRKLGVHRRGEAVARARGRVADQPS